MGEHETASAGDAAHGVVRVLLIAGSGDARQAVERILGADRRTCVVAAVADPATASVKVRASQYDLVMVGAGVLGSDAKSVVRSLAGDSGASVPVVVFGGEPDEYLAAHALKGGAMAYVTAGAPDSELVAAVIAARAGRHHISAALRDRMAFRYLNGP